MKFIFLSLSTMLQSVTGCTTQNAYDGLRYNRELECQKMQGTDRDDCMRRSGMSYDEYQRELNQQQES